MRDINKVILIGNLTRDPEIRTTATGQTVASFAVACNRSWNDAQGMLVDAVEYIDIVAWGKLAEIVGQIYKKGRRTYVEGRLQTRSWDGQDGIKRYKTEVIASELLLQDSQRSGEMSPEPTAHPATAFGEVPQPAVIAADNAPTTPATSDDEINIEDIPF